MFLSEANLLHVTDVDAGTNRRCHIETGSEAEAGEVKSRRQDLGKRGHNPLENTDFPHCWVTEGSVVC